MPQPSRRRAANHPPRRSEATLIEVVAMLLVDSSRLEQVAAIGEISPLPWSSMNADARARYREDARVLLEVIGAGTPEQHRALVSIMGRAGQEHTP